MKAYLVIYPTDNPAKEDIRHAMKSFRLVEHISPNSSVVLTFRNEEDIIELLNRHNPEQLPLLVMKIPATVYASNVDAEYMEPTTADHL